MCFVVVNIKGKPQMQKDCIDFLNSSTWETYLNLLKVYLS